MSLTGQKHPSTLSASPTAAPHPTLERGILCGLTKEQGVRSITDLAEGVRGGFGASSRLGHHLMTQGLGRSLR